MMSHSANKSWVIGAAGACTVILLPVMLMDGRDTEKKVSESSADPGQDPASQDSAWPAAPKDTGCDEFERHTVAATESAPRAKCQVAESLAAAKADLAFFANDSLHGVMYLTAVLEHVLAIAALPVEAHPDFAYEDDDAIAYSIVGLPEGMRGHMLVGLRPYTENGSTYRYLQMDIEIPATKPEFLDGALRDGPNIHLSISYDIAEPGVPTRFALMLQRRVDLAASNAIGIDAYSGQFTQGAYYWHDLRDSTKPPLTTTVGLVNGNPADAKSFPGISPLAGDVHLDPGLLNDVLAQLQQNLSFVKGD